MIALLARFATFLTVVSLTRGTFINLPCDHRCPMSELENVLSTVVEGDTVFLNGGVWVNCSDTPTPILPIALIGSNGTRIECNGEPLFLAVAGNGSTPFLLQDITFHETGNVLVADINTATTVYIVRCDFTHGYNTVVLGTNIILQDSSIHDRTINNASTIIMLNQLAVESILFAFNTASLDNCSLINNLGAATYFPQLVTTGGGFNISNSVVHGNNCSKCDCFLVGGPDINIVNTEFSNNYAEKALLAVNFASLEVQIPIPYFLIQDSIFFGNRQFCGALLAFFNGVVRNSTFIDNDAEPLSGFNATVFDSVFSETRVLSAVIVIARMERFVAHGCVFANTSFAPPVASGSALFAIQTSFKLFGCTVIGNTAGALLGPSSDLNLVFNNVAVVSNTLDGGLMAHELNSIVVEDCLFSANKGTSRSFLTASAALIYNTRLEANLIDGGALICVNTITVVGTSFVSNFGPSAGSEMIGALFFQVSAVVVESVFVNNTSGGAIGTSTGKLIAVGCTFYSNVAETGGAISSGYPIAIYDSVFAENSATLGGAIHVNPTAYADKSLLSVIVASVFTSNVAAQHGGAVYLTSNLAVSDAIFTLNTAEAMGGALQLDYAEQTMDVFESSFLGNVAGIGGGAISVWQGFGGIVNGTFSQNTAHCLGGAIFAGCGSVRASRCNFTENEGLQGFLRNATYVCRGPVCAACHEPVNFVHWPVLSTCPYTPGLPWSLGDGVNVTSVDITTTSGAAMAPICLAAECAPFVVADPHAAVCQPTIASPCALTCEAGYQLTANATLLGCGETLLGTICVKVDTHHAPASTALIIGLVSASVGVAVALITGCAYKHRVACFAGRGLPPARRNPLLPSAARATFNGNADAEKESLIAGIRTEVPRLAFANYYASSRSTVAPTLIAPSTASLSSSETVLILPSTAR